MTPNTVDHPPVLLTIEEAAKHLAVSQTTIRRLWESGELKRVTIGKAVRLLARSVEEFAQKGGATHAS